MMARQPPVPKVTRFCSSCAARTEEPLLHDELGAREIGGGVDALHFVLIVEPVALDAQAGANQ